MPLVRAEYQYYHDLLRRVAARSNQGRNDGGQGAQFPGRRITMRASLTARVLAMSHVQYFTAVHLLSKDLRFEHGAAKLTSCPGRHLILLYP